MSDPQTTPLPVFDYEYGTLEQWHREQQYEHAQRENYVEATEHKKRADEIREYLDAKR